MKAKKKTILIFTTCPNFISSKTKLQKLFSVSDLVKKQFEYCDKRFTKPLVAELVKIYVTKRFVKMNL